jgi:thiol-disulfide isomerase/thioredoxin
MKYNVIALLFTLLFFSGCDSKENDIEQANAFVAQKKYSLVDINNNTYTITRASDQFLFEKRQERVVILDFFATWCSPCKATAPHLAALQKKYPNELLVLGVLLEQNKNKAYVETFMNDYGAHYTIVNGQENFSLAREVYNYVQAPSSMPIPLVVLLKDGKYLNHYIGAAPEEMIESDIKRALGK